MSRELVVDQTPQGARIGLLEEGRLLDVDLADDQGRGRICLGRVRRVEHDLDGAFVDCGLGRDAFLSARDARALSGAARKARIGDQVSEGQAVLVQVKRAAQGDKGPRITADVALPGLLLQYRPRARRIELSPALARSGRAGGQQARGEALLPAGGFVLRRAAPQASDQDLLDEAQRLRQGWAEIEQRAGSARAPALLDPPGDPLRRLLLDHLSPDLERIVFAERTALIRTRNWLGAWLPGLAARLEHLADAFEASGAADQLAEALGPEVALRGGGSLIIEPTTALTAVDVNGAGRRPLEVDLEAAREVARQLRLRQIGGIVVIDFVDLDAKADRARLLSALRSAFDDDPVMVQLYPMSPLGLVELSRQRIGPCLAERLGRAEETASE
ncbi:MAG: ribonuclease E/G [Geminicoccales bacterium]